MSNYQPPPPGYGYPPPGPGFPPQPPPRQNNAGKIIGFGCLGIIAIVVLFAIIGALAGGSSDNTSSSAPPPATEQPAEPEQEPAAPEPEPKKEEEKSKPKPKPKGPPTSFGEGTYLVGEDIKAGTYKTSGPQENEFFENCYWSRNKDDSGELGSIIANGNSKGPVRVTLNKGELIETSGCEKWKRVG